MNLFLALSRRVQEGIVIGILLLFVVPISQYAMGLGEALETAEEFLVSSPSVREYVGPNVEVSWPIWSWRSDFGWTPGSVYATFKLNVAGEKATTKARVNLMRSGDSEWAVSSATFWSSEGPVAIK